MYRVFFLLCRKVWMMTFCKVPSAGGLIQQLPTAHAGQWNIPKCYLPNLATEQKKHSVKTCNELSQLKFEFKGSPLSTYFRTVHLWSVTLEAFLAQILTGR